ncbi:hypothetical protein SLS62_009956 [Diatrype stigma]|uniref:Uncharacterized protein n=1 Tax=Diatrype stigma TaxID=117547 RepID=A0AAN9UEG2_9PEZI
MEGHHAGEKDPDFRSIVNAAAADWYSQRSISPNRRSPQSNAGQSSNSVTNIGSDTTAWQTALLSLPEEFRNSPLPVHPLPQLLAVQPTLRPIEWNRYRQYGGFVPRTPHDFSSLMIYASGQVNPNPCRRCILKNGPFALCIVSPPSVLAQSSLKHACANCTYQNQYKKCTNEPITKEELIRSQASRSVVRSQQTPVPRKPKVASGSGVRKYQHKSTINSSSSNAVAAAAAAAAAIAATTAPTAPTTAATTTTTTRKRKQPDYGYVVQKPSAQSITADSFADKLRHVRSWSPRSRRRMNAEVLQWQAAMATVEAEKVRAVRHDHRYQPHHLRHPPPMVDETPRLPFPTVATTSSMFAPPPTSISGSVPEEMGDEDGQMMDGGEEMEEGDGEGYDNSDGEDEHQYYEGDGPSWVGFDDGPPLKPPL